LSSNWSSLCNNWSSWLNNWRNLSNNRGCLSNYRSCLCYNWRSLSVCNWCSLCSSIVLIVLSIWKISILNCRFHNLFFYCWRTVGLNNSCFSSLNWVFRGWPNWKIGCSNFKSKSITKVINCLNNSIGINIAVASSCDSISCLKFLLSGERIAVPIVKLSNVILGVVLGISSIIRGSCNWINWGSSNNRSCLSNICSCNNLSCRCLISIVGSIRKVSIINSWCHNMVSTVGNLHWCTGSLSHWLFSNSNRSNCCNWLSINMMDREVGCSNSKTQCISNIVDSLYNSISINIAICTTNYTISSFDFLLHRVTIRVSKWILTKIILSMVLRSFWGSSSSNWGSLSICNRSSLGNNWSNLSNNWSRLCYNWSCLYISNWNWLSNNWCRLSNIWCNLSNNWCSLSNNWCSLSNNWSSLCNNWSNSNLGGSFFFNGSKVSSLSSCNFRSIFNRSSLSRWKIGGSYSESCTISNIFNSLENSISVNILVCSSNDPIGSFNLLSDGVWIIVAKTILTNFILSMVLGSCDSISSRNNRNCLCNNWSSLGYYRSSLSNYRSSLGNYRSNLSNWSCLSIGNRCGLSSNWRSFSYNSLSNWSVFIGLSIWKIGIWVNFSCHNLLRSSNIFWYIMNWEVSGCNPKSQGISNIVDSLSQTIGIHIAVGTTDDSISCFNFLLCLVCTRISKCILSYVILWVILGRLRSHNSSSRVILGVIAGIGWWCCWWVGLRKWGTWNQRQKK